MHTKRNRRMGIGRSAGIVAIVAGAFLLPATADAGHANGRYEKLIDDVLEDGGSSGSRSATNTVASPWPDNTVIYKIEDDDEDLRRRFLFGAAIWEEKTHMRFRPATANDEHFVLVTDDGGCWARRIGFHTVESLGHTPEGAVMDMSIASLYCSVHEIGHVIGLAHEHSRPDRDRYIKVLNENIPDESEPLYYIDWNNVALGPYDVESVMHYDAFSDAEPRITTHDGEPVWIDYYRITDLDAAGAMALHPKRHGSYHQRSRRNYTLYNRDTPVSGSRIDWSRQGTWNSNGLTWYSLQLGRAESSVVIGDTLYISNWAGNQHRHLGMPISNGLTSDATHDDAALWTSTTVNGPMPGTGTVLAQAEWVAGDELWQLVWQDDSQWTRTIPLAEAERLGTERWDASQSWVRRAGLGDVPGTGSVDAAAAVVIDGLYVEMYYRDGQRYRRSTTIGSKALDWSTLPAYTAGDSSLPGQYGTHHTEAIYYLP